MFVITVGERHEAVVFESLMEQGAIKRAAQVAPGYVPNESLLIRATAVARFVAIYVVVAFTLQFLAKLLKNTGERLTRLYTARGNELSDVLTVSSSFVELPRAMRKRLKTTLPC